jgi:hypothetical protein
MTFFVYPHVLCGSRICNSLNKGREGTQRKDGRKPYKSTPQLKFMLNQNSLVHVYEVVQQEHESNSQKND